LRSSSATTSPTSSSSTVDVDTPSSTASTSSSSTSSSSTRQDVDFSDYASSGGSDVETWLNKQGLSISDYAVDGRCVFFLFLLRVLPVFTTIHFRSPYSHLFSKDNVDIVDGYLSLKVSGENDGSEVSASQVTTTDQTILYGTFRTVAKLTSVPGVCQAAFTCTFASALPCFPQQTDEVKQRRFRRQQRSGHRAAEFLLH
jgi:hypothetical protein